MSQNVLQYYTATVCPNTDTRHSSLVARAVDPTRLYSTQPTATWCARSTPDARARTTRIDSPSLVLARARRRRRRRRATPDRSDAPPGRLGVFAIARAREATPDRARARRGREARDARVVDGYL